VCRALRVLCAAPTLERLAELRRNTVASHWELVGGALTIDEMVSQIDEFRPDVTVVDADLGADSARRVRAVLPGVRIVAVGGELEGADGRARLESVREVILGTTPAGGPVRS
jgi:hypothetical protein